VCNFLLRSVYLEQDARLSRPLLPLRR
jgi:hypothetical protein